MTRQFSQNRGYFGFGFTFDHPDLMAFPIARKLLRYSKSKTPLRSSFPAVAGRYFLEGSPPRGDESFTFMARLALSSARRLRERCQILNGTGLTLESKRIPYGNNT